MQNFAPSGFSVEQLWQRIGILPILHTDARVSPEHRPKKTAA
jgi:hypothetical protein